MKNKPHQPSLSEQVSAFIRTIQLKSLRDRTQAAYWVWVLRIAKHHGVACPSLLAEEEKLAFIHHVSISCISRKPPQRRDQPHAPPRNASAASVQ